MIAVIIPTGKPENLSPITDTTPESLLPIVNKPILEHQIELLAQHKVKDIFVLLKHKPDQVRKYFGCGERWGVNLSFVSTKKYDGALNTLRQIQPRLTGPILCMQGNIFTNPDITQFMKAHEHGESDITVCIPHDITNLKPFNFQNEEFLEKHIFIIESQLFKHKFINGKCVEQGKNLYTPKIENFHCKPSVYKFCLDAPKSYWEANQIALKGNDEGLGIEGKEISKGIWVGAHSKVHPKAHLMPPLVIGDHCVINKGAVIEQGNVIGDHSIIEEGAYLSRSILWKGTYAGSQTNIKDSIVNKNLLFNIPRKTMLNVSDPFLLGNSKPNLHFPGKIKKTSGSITSEKRLFSSAVRFANRLIIKFNIFKARMKLHKATTEPGFWGSILSSKSVKPKLGIRI